MSIDELLQKPYWVADILPEQVPPDSPGQYFAVEKYFLQPERLAAIRQKHISLVLKLNCYRDLTLDGGAPNPPPEQIAEGMAKGTALIRTGDALILSRPDETYLTVYNPDSGLLALIRAIAAGEGLYVWQPPEQPGTVAKAPGP